MNWFSRERFTWYLFIGSSIVLLSLGLVLDNLSAVNNRLLFVAFHFSGIIGLCLATYIIFKKMSNVWLRALFCLAVFIIWRITYFPAMVIAGFLAGLGESLAISLSLYQLYPVFLLAIGLINFVAVTVTGLAFFVIFHKYRQQQKQKLVYHGVLTSMSLPLAVMAAAVSFSHPSDWHSVADTSFIDNKPLPIPALPQINPYWTAFEQEELPWQQRLLFAAAAITYDKVPSNTRWSRVVKGTLEDEFVKAKEISTAFCTKIHYRAFITAHPYLKEKKNIDKLLE